MISAPSGAGKTSLGEGAAGAQSGLTVSVSHTTRPPRPHEVQGREYWFVTPQEFQERLARGEFLEHARVFDNFYGTGRATVEAVLAAGRDVILEIDWQGARQVRQSAPGLHHHFHPAALAGRPGAAPAQPADGFGQRSSRDACRTPSVTCRITGNSATWWSMTISTPPAGSWRCILAGNGQALTSDRPQLAPLLTDLLGAP